MEAPQTIDKKIEEKLGKEKKKINVFWRDRERGEEFLTRLAVSRNGKVRENPCLQSSDKINGRRRVRSHVTSLVTSLVTSSAGSVAFSGLHLFQTKNELLLSHSRA